MLDVISLGLICFFLVTVSERISQAFSNINFEQTFLHLHYLVDQREFNDMPLEIQQYSLVFDLTLNLSTNVLHIVRRLFVDYFKKCFCK